MKRLALLLCLLATPALAQVTHDYTAPPNSASTNTKRLDLNAEYTGINADKVDFTDIDTSAEIKAIVTNETGSGALVFATSPALVTPTGIVKADVGLGNVDNTSDATKLLAIDTSAEIKALVTDETGSGALVFGTSPAITTPTGIVKGDVGLGNVDNTSDTTKFQAIDTSAELRTLMTDELGTGVLVFLGTPADDQVAVGDSASATTWRTLPDSDGATQKLQYDQTTNAFSAGTDDDVPEAGDFGALALTGDVTSSGLATTVAANAVALTTDTTGNYVADVTAGVGIAITGSAGEAWAPAVAFDYSDAGASPALAADTCRFTGDATTNGEIVCEGDTADAFETRVIVTDPTADRAFTIPNADSNPIQPLTCSSTDKISSISSTGAITCTADTGGSATPLRGYIDGCILSNGTDAVNDTNVSGCEVTSDDGTTDMAFSTAFGKQLDVAWAVGGTTGTPVGCKDTGAISNAWWHIYVIERTDTSVVDILCSLSATSPTMPTNYTKKRLIGSIDRVSASIVAYTQMGDEFLWKTPILDLDTASPGTTAASRTLSTPGGRKVWALVVQHTNNATGSISVIMSSLDTTDTTPGATNTIPNAAAANIGTLNVGSSMTTGSPIYMRTNTSSQVRTHHSSGGGSNEYMIWTLGWEDPRGQNQ